MGLPVVAPRLASITSLGADWALHYFGPHHGDWAAGHDPAELAAAMAQLEGTGPSVALARRRRDWTRERFSLDRMIESHAALYEEVL